MRGLTLLLLLAAGSAWGGEPATEEEDGLATIVKKAGQVQIIPEQGFRKKTAKTGKSLVQGDLILTGEEATAVVAFRDRSKVALDGGTKLELIDPGEVRHEEGKAYYRLREGSVEGRQVRTGFSLIGVKGTEFLVSDSEGERTVAMDDGEVELTAPEGEFKLYREKEAQAFESYKEKRRRAVEQFRERERQAFERYKDRIRREFLEYTESFSLKTGKKATFDGQEATTGPIGDELKQDMQRLRNLL